MEHDGVRIDAVEVLVADGGEFLLEEFAGHRTRVLEITQAFVGEDGQVAVGDYFAEGTLTSVGFGVLLAGQPAEKVGRAVVQRIGNEMVTNTDILLAVFVFEGRTVTIES